MGKLLTLDAVLEAVAQDRQAGKTIVATNGCFDIVHVGHIRNLRDAKALGDVLVVGINSDASVRANKGSGRPYIPARERAELVAALAATDYVFLFSAATPFEWISKLRPDIHVKGGGKDIYDHPDFLMHERVVTEAGGKMVLVPHHDKRSTTALVKKITATTRRSSKAMRQGRTQKSRS